MSDSGQALSVTGTWPGGRVLGRGTHVTVDTQRGILYLMQTGKQARYLT